MAQLQSDLWAFINALSISKLTLNICNVLSANGQLSNMYNVPINISKETTTNKKIKIIKYSSFEKCTEGDWTQIYKLWNTTLVQV